MVHPGVILFEEFIEPLGLSLTQVARDIHVPANRLSMLARGMRSISADTALRLGKYFDMTPNFWMNLQARYDLNLAKRASEGDYKTITKTKAMA